MKAPALRIGRPFARCVRQRTERSLAHAYLVRVPAAPLAIAAAFLRRPEGLARHACSARSVTKEF